MRRHATTPAMSLTCEDFQATGILECTGSSPVVENRRAQGDTEKQQQLKGHNTMQIHCPFPPKQFPEEAFLARAHRKNAAQGTNPMCFS